MKEKCDNHCETCPMQTQIHCVLVYAKANNASVGALAERLQRVEASLESKQTPLFNPIQQDSAILPALEREET